MNVWTWLDDEPLPVRHPFAGQWGHDGDWCRDCQEGCGEAYGGSCYCCVYEDDDE